MKEEGMNYRVTMYPDYDDFLFWDEIGAGCGTSKYVFVYDEDNSVEVDLSSIVGLTDWVAEWEHYEAINRGYVKKVPKIRPEQQKSMDKRGLDFAKAIKRLLPDDVDILYRCSYSDDKFLLTGTSVEKIRG